jgi:hypothetical protein
MSAASKLNTVNYGAVFGCSGTLVNNCRWNTVSGNFYANQNNFTTVDAQLNSFWNINWFANALGLSGGYFYNCNIGYNENNVTMANTYDAMLDDSKGYFSFCKIPDVAGYTNVNYINRAASAPYSGYLYFEHFNKTLNDHRVIGVWGSSKKVVCGSGSPVPSQRSGGSTDAIQLSAQSNISSTLNFQTVPIRIMFTTGTAKTYRFYVQTDYASGSPVLPTAGFKLYAKYIAQTTGLITEATPSTQDIAARTGIGDWSQYVEVTIPSTAQTGWVDLYFQLMEYESGKFVWIDPKVVNP